jgi:hypothetical protein
VPATPEQAAQGERRLLAPFLVERDVACAELRIEMTGNFYDCVGRPAVDAGLHTQSREVGDGFVEEVWTNRAGMPANAFRIAIGEPRPEPGQAAAPRSRYRVINELRIRIYQDRRELTLRAAAGGGYAVVKEGPAEAADRREFVIDDGTVRRP